jgi:hypothetical protein
MSDDSDWHDDHSGTQDERAAAPADGGIPLDAFWARLDPID